MRAELVTPRAAPVVATDDAKLFLRVDHGEEDALIDGLVEAATDLVEKKTGRLLGAQTWRVDAPLFAALMLLPIAPVTAVIEIEAVGPGGVAALIDPASYELKHYSWGHGVGVLAGYSWPVLAARGDAVRITVEAGHDPVPAPLVTAIKLLAATWYQHRDAAVGADAAQELPLGVRAITERYRRFR